MGEQATVAHQCVDLAHVDDSPNACSAHIGIWAVSPRVPVFGFILVAAIRQLGRLQTEHPKVPSLILGLGTSCHC